MQKTFLTRRELIRIGAATAVAFPTIASYAQTGLPKGTITLVVPFASTR